MALRLILTMCDAPACQAPAEARCPKCGGRRCEAHLIEVPKGIMWRVCTACEAEVMLADEAWFGR